jgi:acylphosphatase
MYMQVSGEAQGSEENLEKFLKVINTGPPLAEVSKVEKSEIDTKSAESKFQQNR